MSEKEQKYEFFDPGEHEIEKIEGKFHHVK
jgi:hypothetical protein